MRELPLYRERTLPIERTHSKEVDHDCRKCSLWKDTKTVCMNPVGDPDGLLVVADYPGSYEDALGEPLSGRSGDYLRKEIAKHWTGPIALDNALKCKVGSKKVPEKAVEKCRPYLAATIAEVAPSRVICTGGNAVKAMFGDAVPVLSARRSAGFLYEDGVMIPVFILMNAVNALRNRFMRAWFEGDLEWALTVDPATLPRPPHDGICQIIETAEDAKLVAQACRDAGGVTYDIENAGKYFDDFYQLVSVATTPYNTELGYVWSREALKNKNIACHLVDILADPEVKVSGTWIKHDHQGIERAYNIKVRGSDQDIRLLRKLEVADASGRLEHMAYLVGMGGHKQEMDKAVTKACAGITKQREKSHKAIGQLPGLEDPILEAAARSTHEPKAFAYGLVKPDLCYRYNALDAIATERLRQRAEKKLARSKPIRLIWNKVVKGTLESVTQMEQWGVPVSRPALVRYQEYLQGKMDNISKQFEAYHLNPDSPDQVGQLLYDKLKLNCAHETPTGARSTDEGTLKMIVNDHPIVRAILDHRSIGKLKGTYADGILEHVTHAGRIHPSLDVAGAGTGRTSCSDPNLQNLPRGKDKASKIARSCFVVEPGRRILQIDFRQLEYRVAAMLSADPVMIQMFKDGMDFHTGTAELIAPTFWNKPASEITKEDRSIAKTFNFALMYGMADFTLATRLGCTKAEAARLRAEIMGKWVMLAEWLADRLDETEETGSAWTQWEGQRARRRPLIQIGNSGSDDSSSKSRNTAKNSAGNSPIQGTASDYCIASLVECMNWLVNGDLDAKLFLTVHDSLMFDVAEDDIDEVAHTASAIMTQWDCGPVPLEVDVEVGQTWADLETYDMAVAA